MQKNSLQVSRTVKQKHFQFDSELWRKKSHNSSAELRILSSSYITQSVSFTTAGFFQRKCFDDEAGMRSKVIRTHLFSKAAHHDKNKHWVCIKKHENGCHELKTYIVNNISMHYPGSWVEYEGVRCHSRSYLNVRPCSSQTSWEIP